MHWGFLATGKSALAVVLFLQVLCLLSQGSTAKGRQSSRRGIDPQGFVRGDPGGGVGEAEQHECQGVSEIGVEEVEEENSKDDYMTG